jgi:hypothetical protein
MLDTDLTVHKVSKVAFNYSKRPFLFKLKYLQNAVTDFNETQNQ